MNSSVNIEFSAIRNRLNTHNGFGYSEYFGNKQLSALINELSNAIEGLNNLRKNRNPTIAKIECVVYIFTVWFYFIIHDNAANLAKDGSPQKLSALLPLFVFKIRGMTFQDAMDKYVANAADAYFDDSYQLTIMDILIHAWEEGYHILSLCIDDPASARSFTKSHHIFFDAFREFQLIDKHGERKKHLGTLQMHYEKFDKECLELTQRLIKFEQWLIANKINLTYISINEKMTAQLCDTLDEKLSVTAEWQCAERYNNIIPDRRYDEVFLRLRVLHNLPRSIFRFCNICENLGATFQLAKHEPLDEDCPFRQEVAASFLLVDNVFRVNQESDFDLKMLDDEALDACCASLSSALMKMSDFVKLVKHRNKIAGIELTARDDYYIQFEKLFKSKAPTHSATNSAKRAWLANTHVSLLLLAQSCSDASIYGRKFNIWISKDYFNESLSCIQLQDLANQLERAKQSNSELVLSESFHHVFDRLFPPTGKNKSKPLKHDSTAPCVCVTSLASSALSQIRNAVTSVANLRTSKSCRHYRTRSTITLKRAAMLTGLSQRTIQNLVKAPKNTRFPGLNVEDFVLAGWAATYKQEAFLKHWANMKNHPIPISQLPRDIQRKLGFAP